MIPALAAYFCYADHSCYFRGLGDKLRFWQDIAHQPQFYDMNNSHAVPLKKGTTNRTLDWILTGYSANSVIFALNIGDISH